MDELIEVAEKELWVLERKKKAIKGMKLSKNDKKGKLRVADDEIRA